MIIEKDAFLIKNVIVVDEDSSWHNSKVDILIREGRVAQIASTVEGESTIEEYDGQGHCICAGWCDIGAHCGEPGEEVNETIESLCHVARAGGYNHVAVLSNNTRPFDNRHIISDTRSRARHGVLIYPIASMTRQLAGQELTEILDIANESIPLFSDGYHAQFDNSTFCKALEYVQQCNGAVLSIPGAKRTLKNGQVNESGVSAQMGITGIPGFEEVSRVSAELSLASYAKSALFIHAISHRETIDQIAYRREQGLSIKTSVTALHLAHNESDVLQFNENYKVLPPLRSEQDRQALIRGLRNGNIDIIVSNHVPISSEQKEREFGESPFGAVGLETSFYSVVKGIPDVTPEEISRWLGTNPRSIMGLSNRVFEENAPADFTIFSVTGESRFDPDNSKSMSRNTPYQVERFNGQIIGTVSGNTLYLSDI